MAESGHRQTQEIRSLDSRPDGRLVPPPLLRARTPAGPGALLSLLLLLLQLLLGPQQRRRDSLGVRSTALRARPPPQQ